MVIRNNDEFILSLLIHSSDCYGNKDNCRGLPYECEDCARIWLRQYKCEIMENFTKMLDDDGRTTNFDWEVYEKLERRFLDGN